MANKVLKGGNGDGIWNFYWGFEWDKFSYVGPFFLHEETGWSLQFERERILGIK